MRKVLNPLCIHNTFGAHWNNKKKRKKKVTPLVDGRKWIEHLKIIQKGNLNSEQKALNAQLRKQLEKLRKQIEYKIEIPQEQKMMWCRWRVQSNAETQHT